MLDKFSPQGFTLKQNPYYWDKTTVHVPEIDFPAYSQQRQPGPAAAPAARSTWRATTSPTSSRIYLAKSPDNHTWLTQRAVLERQQRGELFFNITKAPLNDPAVRQAISYGINRQQLSAQGETGYEPPDNLDQRAAAARAPVYLDPSLANNLPATGDAAKVTSILKADG